MEKRLRCCGTLSRSLNLSVSLLRERGRQIVNFVQSKPILYLFVGLSYSLTQTAAGMNRG